MKKIIILSVLIVILAALFASAHPDGLEKVAETLGFLDSGIERGSLMTDYTVPFISREAVSTALAGILGVFLIISLFWGTVFALRKR